MIDDDKGGNRLSRWSKRKMAVAREESAEEQADATETTNADEQAVEDAKLQAELQANREAAEAVDLESLSEESDFSVFMKAGVPEMLKKQAMASLWRTNPIFANVDGLVDYDDDFGSPDLIMKTFKSAYQAGRGYLDLFKEDKEVAEDATALAKSEEPPELVEEAESQPDDDHNDDTGEVREAASAPTDEAGVPAEEPALMEQEPLPKISLRKRLELEQSS